MQHLVYSNLEGLDNKGEIINDRHKSAANVMFYNLFGI